MKILSVISSGYEQGGVETTLVAYRAAFRDMGHDTRVLASDIRPDLPHYADYEFKAIPPRGFRKVINTIFNFSAYRVCRKVLRDFRPDVVILHTMHQVTPAVLLQLRKYPTIQCVHGPEVFTTSLLPWYLSLSSFKNRDYDLAHITLAGRIWYWVLRYPYSLLYNLALKNVNRFLVFSTYTRRILRQDGFDPQLISYVPSGVKPMNRSEASRQAVEPPTITYAGRLEKYKGVDSLIASMTEVREQWPSARLVIAGEGTYADQLKEHVRTLGLSDSVKFIGHIDQSGLGDFYANSTVTVMPSTWPETFGKVGIEAMSVGTPVVATNVGGITDWLHDNENGILVPPSQPDQLAKAITRIIQDPALHAALSSNASKTVDMFSMERYIENLLRNVTEVLTQASSGRRANLS